MKTLKNEKVFLRFDEVDEKFSLHGNDLTDKYNGTTFYNENKRGAGKAWTELEKRFNNEMTYWEALHILDEMKMKIHSYCSVD